MFNNDAVPGKKDDGQRSEPRSSNPSIGGFARAVAPPAVPLQAQPETPAVDLSASGGSKLIVGPSIKMLGVEVTDCDTLIVEGHLEATLDCRLTQVGETGVLSGNASTDVAEIWGRLEGEFTIRQQLIIHPSGRVSGCIRYGKIRVEEGGLISGDISTLSAATDGVATRAESKSMDGATSKQRGKASAIT